MEKECLQCHTKFKIVPSRAYRKYCSKKCEGRAKSGSNCHFWNGGRSVDKDGYVLIKMPEHPNCNPNGYVREHRIVVERYIGRYLQKSEVVHHINGKRDDNRIENLKLFSEQKFHIKEERKHKHFGRKKTINFVCECGSTVIYAKNLCHKCYDHKRNIKNERNNKSN